MGRFWFAVCERWHPKQLVIQDVWHVWQVMRDIECASLGSSFAGSVPRAMPAVAGSCLSTILALNARGLNFVPFVGSTESLICGTSHSRPGVTIDRWKMAV